MPIAMTVADILIRVQRTFGDESAVQVTEDDVIRWINDAQREAVMQHENLLQTESNMDVEWEGNLDLPATVFSMLSVSYRNSETESYYPLKWLARSTMDSYFPGWDGPDFGTGLPQFYILDKADNTSSLYIFPKPHPPSIINDGLKLIYSRYPNDLTTAADPIDLPPYYHSYVEHFCMMKAYEKDEDWESADRKAQLIQSTMDFNNNRESWFGRETYPTVTTRVEDEY